MTEDSMIASAEKVAPTLDTAELASAILEVASIQVDMMRELERVLDASASGGLKFGVSGVTGWQPAPAFKPMALMKRSQFLIHWLLERLPKQGAAE